MEKLGKKQFIKQNEDPSTFSIGHCELIISPIESNGDPHVLRQFGLLTRMNVWHPFMSQIQAKV